MRKGFNYWTMGWTAKLSLMFEKGLDGVLEGINASEKWLDDFATTFRNSKRLPPDMLELNRKFYKDLDEFNKNAR